MKPRPGPGHWTEQSSSRHAKQEKLFQLATLPSSSLERQGGQRSHNLLTNNSCLCLGVKQQSCSSHLDSCPVLVTINWTVVGFRAESIGGSQAKPTDQSISVSDYLQLPPVTASPGQGKLLNKNITHLSLNWKPVGLTPMRRPYSNILFN